ncbi:MAG: hypothetical protein RIC95_06250 [Vicingaceae bacterium]
MNCKRILPLALILLFSLSSIAQGLSEEKREKMEKLKLAYILVELELDEKKAADFQSIYEEYQAERTSLKSEAHEEHKKMRESNQEDADHLENMSEVEALKKLESRIKMEEKKLAMEKKYLDKMVASIGAKKVLQFKKAEHDFRRELLHMYKDDKHRHHMEKELIERRKAEHMRSKKHD